VGINSTGGPRIATRYSHHSHNRSGENRPQPRPENFVQAEWIMLHVNPDFRGFVDFLRGELDRIARAQEDLCRDFFCRAVALELSFFEAAYTDRT
jgi:thiaminase